MHITLDASITDLDDIGLRAHGPIIDSLLTQHLHRAHLLVLSPKQVNSLRGAIQFGPQNTRALDTILRRTQDYQASMRASGTYIRVMPLDSGVEIERRGQAVAVGPQWLSNRIAVSPSFFVENGVNDGQFYGRLIRRGIKLVGGDPAHVSLRPTHGGGQTLGAVIETLYGAELKGLCVCDRDTSCAVPPFNRHSTGEGIYAALLRMGVLDDQGLEASTNPFFAFHPTEGWAVENYVGPHQLDAYFSARPEAGNHRGSFAAAFPNFPDLNELEMTTWMVINFRAADQPVESVRTGVVERAGTSAHIEHAIDRLARLTFPGNALTSLSEMASRGRYVKDVALALERDLRSATYREAVRTLASRARDILAADDRMSFS